MYLLDTNIWLERLLGQAHAEEVGQFLDTVPADQLLITDFTLHSLGVILNRLGEATVFTQLVQDVLIDGAVNLIRLSPMTMYRVVAIMEQYSLDLDDAYQYVVAEREQAMLVSFDRDFDRTARGRQTPAQVLVNL